MLISKESLKLIISEALVNESFLLLSLLAGCKSECNLYSVSPELKNLTIPECVTEEIYPFENLDWVSGVKPSDLQKVSEDSGYTVDIRDTTYEGSDYTYVQMKVTIPNVPSQLVEYYHNVGLFAEKRLLERYDNQLCDVDLYFIKYENDDGKVIVLKNAPHLRHLERGDYPDWIDKPYSSGTICRASDVQCNEDFMAVVANVNPKMTPDEDTGI
jgi:hypothetical protein